MSASRPIFAASLFLGLLLMTGCGAGDRVALGPETDDSNYREGQQLEKAGRYAEALNAYLKTIEYRGVARSPESHLQAAILYKERIGDPYEAVHYFKVYTEYAPSSPQVTLARQQMDAAKREILTKMPGQLFADQGVRANAAEELARLQNENNELRAQLQTLRGNAAPLPPPRGGQSPLGGAAAGATPFPAGGTTAGAASTANSPFTPVSGGGSPAASQRTGGVVVPGIANSGQRGTATPGQAAAGGRRHKIVAGDTLYNIAQKYYGNSSPASIKAIQQANTDVMKNINVLPRVGTELVIPPKP